jgi:hypothetical protein
MLTTPVLGPITPESSNALAFAGRVIVTDASFFNAATHLVSCPGRVSFLIGGAAGDTYRIGEHAVQRRRCTRTALGGWCL